MALLVIGIVVGALIVGLIWGFSGSKRDSRKLQAVSNFEAACFLEVAVEVAAEVLVSALD